MPLRRAVADDACEATGFEFSIVTAVYNSAEYVADAIESVLRQQGGFGRRTQLILVDDGSTDGSGGICDEYARRFPSSILVVHKGNGGAASARAAGLELATGRYIGFLDSDDLYGANVLERVGAFFDDHPDDVDIAAIPIMNFGAIKGPHWQNRKFEKGTRVIDLMDEHDAIAMFGAAMFVHSRVKHLVRFDERLVCGEDQKVILSILKGNPRLGVVAGCWYKYRRRTMGGLVHTGRWDKRWYGDYLTHLTRWALDEYEARYGHVPAFVQYQMMCDLQLRIREEIDGSLVLTPGEQASYRDDLRAVYRRIDDRIILEQERLSPEQKSFVLLEKYGRLPELVENDDGVVGLAIGQTRLGRASDVQCGFEELGIVDDTVALRGWIWATGPDGSAPSVWICDGDRRYACEVLVDRDGSARRRGSTHPLGVVFRANVPIDPSVGEHRLVLAIGYGSVREPVSDALFGLCMPIGSRPQHGFCRFGAWDVRGDHASLVICRSKPLDRVFARCGQTAGRLASRRPAAYKAVAVRGLTRLLGLFKRRTMVLADARVLCDEGHAALVEVLAKSRSARVYAVLNGVDAGGPFCPGIGLSGSVKAYSTGHKVATLLCDAIVAAPSSKPMNDPFGASRDYYRDRMAGICFIDPDSDISKLLDLVGDERRSGVADAR